MDTPFENLDKDARDEWRAHPVTRAYLATVTDTRDKLQEGLLYTIQAGSAALPSMTLGGGELKGLNFCLHMANTEPSFGRGKT
jgi:hypothetical protein